MASNLQRIAILFLALVVPNPTTIGFDRIGPRPVVIGEVAYVPHSETRPEGDKAIFVRATIRAVDVRTDRELWSIRVRDSSPPPGSAIDDAIRSMVPFSKGILVRTFAGSYYIDPSARSSRPVLDDRVELRECEVHHRGLEDDLIPIHYGLAAMELGRPEDRAKLFPHASSIVNAGCLVREARSAAIRYCPACRDAARASTNWPGGEPK